MEPKRTQGEERAYGELLARLDEQERRMRAFLASGDVLPTIGARDPDRATVALDLALDADVVKWLKGLDDAWSLRANAILRAYAREAWR